MISRSGGRTKYGTLKIENQEVISWFCGLEPYKHEQDEWIQEVTGHDTACVSGYSIEFDDMVGPKMEIDYQYLVPK